VNYLTGRGVGLNEGCFVLAGGLGLVEFSAHEDSWSDTSDVSAELLPDDGDGERPLNGLHSVSVRIGAA
jgi:hypothetical protein